VCPAENAPKDSRRPTVDIIIPVFNEAAEIARQLTRLRSQTDVHTTIVVDGGSSDGTAEIVRALANDRVRPEETVVRVIDAPRGRASQMNVGAARARADVLLFLHTDTRLPADALERVRDAVVEGAVWGRFDVRLDGKNMLFRAIERMMNLRSALTGVATGDQAIFARRDVFHMLGGYAPIALMEDVELCTRLKWVGWPVRIATPVRASDRRWRIGGILRTVVLMWTLRLLYWLGVSPSKLARAYATVR
jgi:rSAM/selenodomain-associated transferase 2